MTDEINEEVLEETEPKRTKVIYTGNGAFVHGVPARDLLKKEWNALSKEMRDSLLRQGIYEIVEV
jgi:hypothetical protein